MPSWQCNVFNLMARVAVKQSLRTAKTFEESLKTFKSVSQSKRQEPVTDNTGFPFDGEWIKTAGSEKDRIIMYLPGGGFISPASTGHVTMLTKLCQKAKASALLVHYRLLPEHPYPDGLNDCVEAYKYLLARGHKAENIVIAGDSAGGCLTLSTMFRLHMEGLPLPCCGALLSPLTDLTYSGESRTTNRWHDPILAGNPQLLNRMYLVDGTSPKDPIASPLFGDFTGLPPILAQVGSSEILLDDVLRLAPKARAQAVDFQIQVWQETPHVWQIMGFLPEADEALDKLAVFFDEHWHNPLLEKMKTAVSG